MVCGGEHLPVPIYKQFLTVMSPQTRFALGYGMTEILVASYLEPEILKANPRLADTAGAPKGKVS